MIYMVENDIADPAREDAWNRWYTQHVTTAFHGVPGWRTGQRFAAVDPATRPRYRAMYTVDSAAVMHGAAYKSTSGGKVPPEWRAIVLDLRRNLADGAWMPTVAAEERLVVVDAAAGDESVEAGRALATMGVALAWWNVVDLDRSVARRAIAVVDRAAGEAIVRRALPGVGVYAPMFDQYVV